MKKLTSIFTLILLVSTLVAQEKIVEIIEKKEDGKVVLYAKNNSTFDHSIEVKINLLNATTNVELPIKEMISAGEERSIAEISPIDPREGWTYSIGFSYEKHIEQVDVIIDDESIIVYTMQGCGRCKYAMDFFKKNDIKYHEYNTTNNDANSIAMWKKLKEVNFGGNSIKMPVIIANGATHYNISDLAALLETFHE